MTRYDIPGATIVLLTAAVFTVPVAIFVLLVVAWLVDQLLLGSSSARQRPGRSRHFVIVPPEAEPADRSHAA